MTSYLGVSRDDVTLASATINSSTLSKAVVADLFYLSNKSGITAGTTRTQAGATALTLEINRVDTSTAVAAGGVLGDGVALMASAAGLDIAVINNTANNIQVYGNGSDTINGVAGATGVALPPGDVAVFACAVAGAWHYEAGVGSSGVLPRLLTASGITAGTTRTQAGATVLAADINRVDTSTAPAVGTVLGDGVVLQASVFGLDVVVINNTANNIQVYANGSDTINGVAGATGVAIPPGDVATFVCGATAAWHYDAGMGSSGSFPVELAADSIAAAGSTQGTATQLAAIMNRVTTATAGSAFGVKLPVSAGGLDVIVENHSGIAIQVYGAGTDTIDDVPTATGVVQMDSSVVIFTCYAPGKWYSNGLATGYAKNPQSGTVLETMQYSDGLTAVGTNQATALQLIAMLNNVTTAAAGTGVNLPASAPGLSVIVENNANNSVLVYPAQGASDTINGQTAANGVLLLNGTVATFNCTAAGAWTVQSGLTRNAAINGNTATASTTLTAANISGGIASVSLLLSGTLAGAANAQLPTVAALVQALHTPIPGTSYRLRVINASSANFAWTVTTNTGWTLTGTMSIPQNTTRDFVITLSSLTAATIQTDGTGTYS